MLFLLCWAPASFCVVCGFFSLLLCAFGSAWVDTHFWPGKCISTQRLVLIWLVLLCHHLVYRLYGNSHKGPSLWAESAALEDKLDDGWPESVEEQGLLLLVWRHNFTNNIWKMCYRQSRRGVSRQNSEKCKTIVCIANTFTHRSFYTQTLLHTKAFTHRSFYTQKLLHTKAFTHTEAFTDRHFHTQTLLHTGACTHRRFYTQKLLHTDAFTQTLLHTKLLPTEAFTDRSFYTQTLLHRCFYTQTLLHTDTFTHRHF